MAFEKFNFNSIILKMLYKGCEVWINHSLSLHRTPIIFESIYLFPRIFMSCILTTRSNPNSGDLVGVVISGKTKQYDY